MRDPRESGLSLIELLASLVILLVGVLAFMGTLTRTSALTRDTELSDIAKSAVVNVMEDLRATSLANLKTLYGPTGARRTFWVEANGEAVYSAPAAVTGTGSITIYPEEDSLPEDFADFDGECDLNWNGSIDGEVDDFRLLPLRVTLTVGAEDSARFFTWDYLLNPE